MPAKGAHKTRLNAAWIERNDLEQLNVRVPRDLLREFAAECERRGVSKRHVVATLIRGWLREGADTDG